MIITILAALILLGICIFIHELGHLLMGMLVGAKAKVFSMGYGKGIWKKEVNGTTYQVTAIPLGGYVQFYGHDYYSEDEPQKGDFMSLPPLRRIIPVLGGPLFNLILGAIIYFAISLGGIDFIPNQVVFSKNNGNLASPAQKAGLKEGDRITSVNGLETPDFMEVFQAIALAEKDKPIDLTVERNGKTLEKKLEMEGGGLQSLRYLGLRVPGTFRLKAAHPKDKKGRELPIHPFEEKDTILSINGIDINSYEGLKEVLTKNRGKVVDVTVLRNPARVFSPWGEEEVTFQKDVKNVLSIKFTKIRDKKYPSIKPPDISFLETQEEWIWARDLLVVDGKRFKTQDELRAYLTKDPKSTHSFRLQNLEFKAVPVLSERGLLGIGLGYELTEKKEYRENVTLGDRFEYTAARIASDVRVTWQSLGMLIGGRISAKDSLAGPVEIVKQAGDFLKKSFKDYLDFMARISIILMFMNLLPLPVVDGGHIVFFLIEAVRGKPLPPRIMDFVMRLGFFFLLGLGMFVMFNDIMRNI